jgi:protein gp37
MGARSKIEWTDASWNPVTGCTEVSAGCDHCYARDLARRFAGTSAYPAGFEVTLRPKHLYDPLRWQGPRRVFVNSMSDLFHRLVPTQYIAQVFATMALAPAHTFQILTKRPGRMASLLSSAAFRELVVTELPAVVEAASATGALSARSSRQEIPDLGEWPLANVWAGVSVESQKWADVRVPVLQRTPAAVRFLSMEPLLSRVQLCSCDGAAYEVQRHPFLVDSRCPLHGTVKLDWVIVGGESGPKARPMHPDWPRDMKQACQASGIAYLFKQWGEWVPCSEPVAERDDVFRFPDGVVMRRVGRRAAGRELDGKTWDEYPATVGAA